MSGPYEAVWRERQKQLQPKGYMPRARFWPGWTPSWIVKITPLWHAEDSKRWLSVGSMTSSLVDETRMEDGKLVCIKRVWTDDKGSHIAPMLSKSDGPSNHSVPILDAFVDPADESFSYLVMPFLLPVCNPPFHSVGEILDFVDQVFEGLVFMHSKGVAHRNCSKRNLVMDATAMYPRGFHPAVDFMLPDYSGRAPMIPRSMAGVKYYFVDHRWSLYFSPGSQPRLVIGNAGTRDRDVPELRRSGPYDPFKMDMLLIGNALDQLSYEEYSNIGFLTPLILSMGRRNPYERPTAEQAFHQWRLVRR
ncbi:hypothetical protein BC834DRAFT_924050 [Gloeopeniophorella convolvens]|nr:hypothetical protein BC834DRAFT_924050 [Gloeopeniophorella convolvens]